MGGWVLGLALGMSSGSGFGAAGEGYFRISAFNSRERAIEAARRLAALDFTKAG